MKPLYCHHPNRSIRAAAAALAGVLLATSSATATIIYNLGTLGGTDSLGHAVNHAGQVAGDSWTTGNAAYRTDYRLPRHVLTFAIGGVDKLPPLDMPPLTPPADPDFAFDLDNTAIMASPDGAMVVAITPWTSTGFHPDGTPFDRPGRATLVLQKQPDGRWLGVHSHMSLQRGVPQDSHGKRAVKAR